MKFFCTITVFIIAIGELGLALGADNAKKISEPQIQKNTAKRQQIDKRKNEVNLNLNEETVIKLAEIILENRYGENVRLQRPWNAKEEDSSFIITGTLHTKLGGVAKIVISKSDARVLSITHGK